MSAAVDKLLLADACTVMVHLYKWKFRSGTFFFLPTETACSARERADIIYKSAGA